LRLQSLCNILSDERMGLSFTIAAGPRQHSHSQVRVPRYSWPHFTFSNSSFPQPGGLDARIYTLQEQGGPIIPPGTVSSPPTTRRATVEVFDSASARDWKVLGWCPRYITHRHGPCRKQCFQQFFYCCEWTRCHGNLFLSRSLPSNGSTPYNTSMLTFLHPFSRYSPFSSLQV
jgi:hypothetical protein